MIALLDMIAPSRVEHFCRRCHRRFWFVAMPSGKSAPITEHGSNHFIDCPGADDFRKERST
jgi:hypothetical protein